MRGWFACEEPPSTWTNFDVHHNPNPGYRVTYVLQIISEIPMCSVDMRLFEPLVVGSINDQAEQSCCEKNKCAEAEKTLS